MSMDKRETQKRTYQIVKGQALYTVSWRAAWTLENRATAEVARKKAFMLGRKRECLVLPTVARPFYWHYGRHILDHEARSFGKSEDSRDGALLRPRKAVIT